ncbi:MAG: site-specific DNA-methyltransferase [Verrucomicrobia subdivision 3 bacterium]|nr:site-specific DNA-methyltransferase [Verrucomicrobiota bacterium]MCC6819410.1 site-specific DNA-methyltransferase [Limisphaerales bacterium]
MNHLFPRIDFNSAAASAHLATAGKDVVVISVGAGLMNASALDLMAEAVRLLGPGGRLWLYGPPRGLPFWGEHLMTSPGLAGTMVFKYWIALDLAERTRHRFLQPNHQGLLLFMKRDVTRKTPTQFRLNTAEVRVSHVNCAACGLNVKDWGGKKHLMNPRGAAPADVWRDLPRRQLQDGVIPADVLSRIASLSEATGQNSLHLVLPREPQLSAGGPMPAAVSVGNAAPGGAGSSDDFRFTDLELDHVYRGDCVSFLQRVQQLHPDGVFDLAFADPPYNLQKGYGNWDDAMAEQHYLAWCNAWLDGMAQSLKPGGSLLVLNLPKWAIHHAAFLNRRLDFRHWIVWDALSDPRGKLMPAHYALLYYTKPGGKPVFNYAPVGTKPRGSLVPPPDSLEYCLRAKCVKQRKAAGDDAKVELSDIWSDIHRIKHRRDRDAHPCQLPEKLMERIIKLTTRPGDVVFDPFCGAGTTALAARKLGRKFVLTDVDANYVRITNYKLAAMNEHADMFGEFMVPRASVIRSRGAVSKREIELYLQSLARKLGRVPTEDDVTADRPGLLREIDLTYNTRSAAFKRAKIGL